MIKEASRDSPVLLLESIFSHYTMYFKNRIFWSSATVAAMLHHDDFGPNQNGKIEKFTLLINREN